MDLVQQLLNPRTRREAALRLGYQGVAKFLYSSDPKVRAAATEALGYFPEEGVNLLVSLLGKEIDIRPVVAGLKVARYPFGKLLVHRDGMVRSCATHVLPSLLELPRDREEIVSILRVAASEADGATANGVLSALAGKFNGEMPLDVFDALIEAIEKWGNVMPNELECYVYIIAAQARYPRLRKRAIDALKRLAKINNPMGRIAAQKLREIG